MKTEERGRDKENKKTKQRNVECVFEFTCKAMLEYP